MQSIYLKKRGLYFLEKPVTENEVKIAVLMRDYFEALSTADLFKLSSVFFEDALIHASVAGYRIVDKIEYLEKMKIGITKIRPIFLNDISIRIATTSQERATAGATFLYKIENRIIPPKRIFFELQKRNDVWKVIKQLYI